MKTEKLKLKLTLLENQLGTCPKNKGVYTSYIATKTDDKDKRKEEVQTVQEVEEKGWTGFHQDKQGIFIYDYMVKGFLKNAGNVLKGQKDMKNVVSKIDNFVFVFPRRIYPRLNGKPIHEPHGILERPLRAQTMQGPRVTLARSDYLLAGCEYEFSVTVVDNTVGITVKFIESLFEYGELCGLGQWRNGSQGRFSYKIIK